MMRAGLRAAVARRTDGSFIKVSVGTLQRRHCRRRLYASAPPIARLKAVPTPGNACLPVSESTVDVPSGAGRTSVSICRATSKQHSVACVDVKANRTTRDNVGEGGGSHVATTVTEYARSAGDMASEVKDDARKQDCSTSRSSPSGFMTDKSLVKEMAILTCSQFVLNASVTQVAPMMPLLAAQMGGDLGTTGIGMIIAAPSAAMFLCNVPLGRLCDTVGRLPLMYGGVALTAVGTGLTAFSTSAIELVFFRLVVGAGVSASMTASTAYLADLTDRAPQHRAKIMGISSAVSGSVWVVGPAIGGFLAEMYGFRNSFLVASVGYAACAVGYFQLSETLKVPKPRPVSQSDGQADWISKIRKHSRAWLQDVKPLLNSSNQQALVAITLVPSLRWSCFMTVVTLHATATVGAGPREIGLMFTALSLAQVLSMPLGSYFADRRPPGARLALVLPAGLTSCLAFASISGASTMEHYLAAMALQGFCNGFTLPSQGAFRAEVTPPEKRGQALSLERQAGSIVSLSAPVLLGMLADCTSCPTAILLTSGLMVACHVTYMMRGSLMDGVPSGMSSAAVAAAAAVGRATATPHGSDGVGRSSTCGDSRSKAPPV